MTNIDYDNTLLFEFDGELEFITYCNVFKNAIGNKQVIWSKGNDYIEMFLKGFNLFEDKQYKKAIKVLEKSLEFNPIGLSARFEIAESYIALRDYSKAKETLLAMKDILTTNSLIARFYRRLGYIFSENEQYDIAYSCFVQSKKYENTPQAEQEIAFICSKTSIDRRKSIEKILRDNDIPLIPNKVDNVQNNSTTKFHENLENIKTSNNNMNKADSDAVSLDSDTNKTNIHFDNSNKNVHDIAYCRKCGTKLNEDSQFCHKCATKIIYEVKQSKELLCCTKCGKNVPSDSKFCQYCGSSSIEKDTVNIIDKNKEKQNKNISPAFIIGWFLAVVALCLCIVLYGMIKDYERQLVKKDEEISTLNSKNSSLNSQLSVAKNYQSKASSYDKLVTAAKKITSYSDLYANKYILYKPNKERVYITLNTGESIWAQCSSGSVSADWSKSWNGYQTSIIISYSGSGVETVKIYPDKRESHAIYIVVFG